MPILVTTATSQRSKPRPSRSTPPRAVSSTAASTSGCSRRCGRCAGRCSRRCRCMRRRRRRRRCWSCRRAGRSGSIRWAIRRTVVVLPLVPATATTGMRPSSPGSEHVRRNDGFAHRRGPCRTKAQVHAQAGRGVDFDDAAALLFERLEHRRRRRRRRRCRGRWSGPRRRRARPVRGARRRSRRWRCRRCSGWRCCAASRACPCGGTLSASGPGSAQGGRGRCRRSGSWSARWRDRRRGADRCSRDRPAGARYACRRRPPAAESRRAAAISLSPTTSRR
jgi:hypothetical protein